MRIKTFLTFTLLLILITTTAYPRTIVFPFKVNSSENRAHQWLGRGISLYLSYGLRINRIDTYSDYEGRGLLKSLHIKFPYNVSKASIIRAAKLMRAEKLVWGEITSSPGPGEEILSIRTFVIDLRNLRQKYLPVIKGKVTDLFAVKNDLLGNLILYSSGAETTPKIPELEIDLRNYEVFIKGLLIDNNGKKAEFLEKVRSELSKDPGMLLFELARTYFVDNDHVSARKILDEIDPDGPFRGEKFFLSGVINYMSNDIDKSFSDFSNVLDCGECKHEALNNISLIYALNNEYSEAMDSIKRSVRSGMMSESFFNAVNISTLLKDRRSAWNFLMEGLTLYPSDEDLIIQLFDLIEHSIHRDKIKPAFLKFLPGFPSEQIERKIFFKLINPFVFSEEKYDLEFPNGNGENIFIKGAEDESKDEIEKKLITNPFLPENHSKLALIYFKEGKLDSALNHGHAALYLLKNPDNYLMVMKIIRKQNERDKLKEILIEALKYFPDSEKLKNFSLNKN